MPAKKFMSFTSNNINKFNKLFYTKAEKGLVEGLPDLFTKLDLFNIALYKYIVKKINRHSLKNTDEINVLEIASGKKMDRWKTFMQQDKKLKWNVLLTDFDKSLLPNVNNFKNSKNFKRISNFQLKNGVYNLFDGFSKLKKNEKVDVVLSSYTFDNVWLKNDLHLTKEKNIWYKNLYSVDIPKVGGRLNKQFFKSIKIKTKRKKINLSTLEHGKYIEEFFKNDKKVHVNYPAGLISAVIDSFGNVLKKDGIFITADIATIKHGSDISGFKSVNETIKIKIENYALAKFILEKLGYEVELLDVCEFIKKTGIITPVPIHDHFVFSVMRSGG